jgi:hypothetical protein
MTTLKVTYPPLVNSLSFELLLLNHYIPSRNRAQSAIRFDLSHVQRFDLFNLSLLAIWIDELSEKGKRIELVYPNCSLTSAERHLSDEKAEAAIRRRKDVCTSLNRWGFDTYLNSRNVVIIGYDQDYRFLPYSSQSNELLPIRLFQNYQSLNDFLTSLQDSKQFEFVFRDTVSLAVIGSGGIRDTILRELGNNIFDHAKGKCGLITICQHQALPNSIAAAARHRAAPDIEQPFFHGLGTNGYIELVVADHGPGIFKTLKDVYVNDSNVSEESRRKPKEPDVIAYAFEKYTTSKMGERLKYGSDEVDPGRGLHWVKEVAFENKGLLSVRSGSSIVQFNFLSSNNKLTFRTNKHSEHLDRLANLGGTQIKMYFPIAPELNTYQPIPTTKAYLGAHSKKPLPIKYIVLELSKFASQNNNWTEVNSHALLEALPKATHLTREITTLILDFANVSFEKDLLFPLLIKLAELQQRGINIICMYPRKDPQLLNVASNELAEAIQKHAPKLKPFLLVMPGGFDVLGLSTKDSQTLNNCFQPPSPVDSTMNSRTFQDFAYRHQHLFDFLGGKNKLILKTDIMQVRRTLANHYKESLVQVIKDKSNGVFYKGHFVLPSHVYVEGYFRINTILTFEDLRRRIIYFTSEFMNEFPEKPDYIVTICDEVKALGLELVKQLEADYKIHIEHLHIDNPKQSDLNAGLFLVRLLSKKVVILNSVIGTAETLNAILDICQEPTYKIQVLGIFSIIDARPIDRNSRLIAKQPSQPIEYNKQTYTFGSILRHPLKFYYERPARWRREDVIRIDPSINAPNLEKPSPATEPLWESVDDIFLSKIVKRSGALYIGHYTRRDRHYIYFFDMARIAQNVGEEIAERIERDVKALTIDRVLETDDTITSPIESNHNIACIIYDGNSRGAQSVSEHIASLFVGPHPKAYSIQEFKDALPFIKDSVKNKDIIIFSNGVFRGHHIQRLIDDVSTSQPNHLFVYIGIHRRESDSVPFYQKVEAYAGAEAIGVRIRYFVEIEIPVFTEWDCPSCNRLKELNEISDLCQSTPLRTYIEEERINLNRRSITGLEDIDPQSSKEMEELVHQTLLRWHLGLAKTNIPSRYILSDVIQAHEQSPDDTLRLFEVMAREIGFLKSYKELFYPAFCDHLKTACLDLLDKCQDDLQRERFALIILRHIAPDALINNLVNIFKGVSRSTNLTSYLFIELLILTKSQVIDIERIAAALELCQQTLEWDEKFVSSSVEDVTRLQYLLHYVRRELRIEEVRRKVSDNPLENVVAKLYNAFVHTPKGVHPKLLTYFSYLTAIHSAESFEQLYTAYYAGDCNVANIIEEILPALEVFSSCLQPATKDYLNYFLSKGRGRFADDWKIFDDSFRSMATLMNQGRLTDADVESLFFYNAEVNTAIDRLTQFVFAEDTSLIREVLIKKFTKLSDLIEGLSIRWKERFEDQGIEAQYKSRNGEVFIPKFLVEDVLDSLLQNIYEHAFETDTPRRIMKISVEREIGHILINVCDTGRGLTEMNLENRQDGGIRRARRLITPYKGSIQIKDIQQGEFDGFTTVVEIKLLSKEMILSCLEKYS